MAKKKHPLAQAPLDELAAELGRRRAALPKLRKRRDKLRKEIETIDAEIATLEAIAVDRAPKSPPGNRSKSATASTQRRPRSNTLREKIGKILGEDPMRPAEIASELVEKGLHQGGKALNIQVSTTLAKFEEFSKVARGQWTRKD